MFTMYGCNVGNALFVLTRGIVYSNSPYTPRAYVGGIFVSMYCCNA